MTQAQGTTRMFTSREYVYGQICLESLNPDIKADSAIDTNAKKAKIIEAHEASVNMLSAPPLMLLVTGIAADSAEINRYAVT